MTNASSPPLTRVIASCSFCGKDDTRVKRLVAGPGVYICNECVGLCDEILATTDSAQPSAVPRAVYEQWSAEEILAVLPAVWRNAESVESGLRDLVGRLRATDISWQVIATRLGLTAEGVRNRFEGR
jgi:hypothetical protein